MSNPTDDVKTQTLLANLEEMFEDDDDERYILHSKQDEQLVYSGEICVQMLPITNDDDTYILTVGQIPDERHARKLVAAANAVPQLLAYITQLEAKVNQHG